MVIGEVVDIDGKTKAILVGREITIDGFSKRRIRIVTHAHYDHVGGLSDSIMFSEYIIATPATHDLLVELGYVRKNQYSSYLRKRLSLEYYDEREFYGHSIELLPVTHILGSAQVRIVYDGLVIGYTSDFKMGEHTDIIKEPDILVIEATYGCPACRRPFKNDVIDLILDIIHDGLKRYGRVNIYSYYGKLQEIMRILRERGVEEPFVMNKKIYSITGIAEKYGWRIGNYYRLGTREAREIINSQRYILFEHMVKAKYRRLDGSTLNIILSGHEHEEPVRKIDEYTWLAAFSDHADFDELLEYVEKSSPKIVVVDGSREGYPYTFMKELRKRGWNAVVLPQIEQ